ncbi:MAG: deoxyhypusine synthase [Proteobacteria bacterium]|nr:deoxyhypusine synthase [Pseudomonadota bacterium]MBU2470689.1 deoxyhypusine synthase [Pseudomonadota bacterium]MBU2516520.1 deoxyhypusine synthase [Pseudomonadota bacterium]
MSRKMAGEPIAPAPLERGLSTAQLVDNYFLAYNAARLREGCRLWARRMARPEVTVAMSLTGALTPAGLGASCLVPLVRWGLVDFIVSTGANLYHDAHFALGLGLHRSSPFADDAALRDQGLVRIYDIVMDYTVLLKTDAFFREMIKAPEFQRAMGTAEFHYLAGKYLAERQRVLNLGDQSLLAACFEMEVPVYAASPGDSSIGMNAAALALSGSAFAWDVNRDVNETAALVLMAKRGGGKTGVAIMGGGAPKNFTLQTEPHLQEVLGIDEKGHDYFLQITDARPDTGGLSGATPSEAVSWGKVDPEGLPDTVVCYTDTTIALPIITSYLAETVGSREPKRLYARRDEALELLKKEAKV